MTCGTIRAAVLVALAWPAAALAQDEGADEQSIYQGNHITVGVGGGYGPDYDGSDNYEFNVVPALQGKIGALEINPRNGGLALDFIPDRREDRIGFALGLAARVRTDRTGNLKDDVVESLGELDTAVEVGPTAGISFYQLLNPYDSVSFSTDVRWDMAKAHEGMVVAPTLSYFTPLSRSAFVSLGLNADYVDGDYADYYFTVTPAGSAVSGLPAFDADGGWKSVGVRLTGGLDLDGDAVSGGFALFALAGYSRLLGDFKDTPLTSLRGDADQFSVGAGVGYTF